MIIGIDEVGRGCWAGPLVAAAVKLADDFILPEGQAWKLVDSKKLNKRHREASAKEIKKYAQAIGVGWVTPEEINKIGLSESVWLAMRRAIDEINILPEDEIIIDGNINYLELPRSRCVIKADDSVPAVSAASIIAKVARDNYMAEIAQIYPQYGFEKHVGYGTALHLQALNEHGVTPIHRINYKPIQRILEA